MAGSVDLLSAELNPEKIESLPEYFDPMAVIKDDLPPVVAGGEEVKKREIVLGRNVHTTCLEVTEPDVDDEVTGERDAYMASVLARYRSYPYNLDFDYGALGQLQHFSINNLGDPFIESNYGVHSRQFEVVVLDWFARLWELEKNEYWGYITNCGTEGNLHGATVKGAVDDLDLVIKSLEETGFTNDSNNNKFLDDDQAPKVTFKKPIGSVSVSGHKFAGCPMPCGVQITRLQHINALSRNVEYLASRDATIMGGRNGHAPIFLWYTLNRKGYRGFQKEVQKCLRNAHYLKDRLRAAGIGAVLNELSSTVVFERPLDEEFVRKWQLACQGNIAHVVVMPNITVEKLDDFLNELINKRAAWYHNGKLQSPCVASDLGKENCLCELHK
ncbi:hypothetical protein RJ639_036041 [Escallonia herrerae]|uniref:Histidine decarboxylase n=1 Tax=Escallonia herrerae TaxID=1293975 RepID=A0AA88WPK5_9ASTE|nr:hypothetical protein RJ639_036041 [Escallonia herrerae]